MSVEHNKALFRRLLDELNRGNLGVVDEIVAPDAILIAPHHPDPAHGPAEFKAEFGGAGAALDLQYTLEEQVAEGDRVAARFIARGTHQREFLGIPPSRRPLEIPVQVLYRVADGKITEYRLSFDQLDLLRQLGAAPGSTAAPS